MKTIKSQLLKMNTMKTIKLLTLFDKVVVLDEDYKQVKSNSLTEVQFFKKDIEKPDTVVEVRCAPDKELTPAP